MGISFRLQQKSHNPILMNKCFRHGEEFEYYTSNSPQTSGDCVS